MLHTQLCSGNPRDECNEENLYLGHGLGGGVCSSSGGVSVCSLTAAVPEGRRLPGRGLHTAAKRPPIPVSKRHSQNEGQGHRFTCL